MILFALFPFGVQTLTLPGVTGTYAAALYTQAQKQGVLANVEKEVRSLKELLDTDAAFRDFVKDPTISQQKKGKILQEILAELKVSPMVREFFGMLGERGRLAESGAILAAFEGAAGSGAVKAVVTTFEALTDGQRDELSSTLQQLTGSNAKLAIENKVDPFILGESRACYCGRAVIFTGNGPCQTLVQVAWWWSWATSSSTCPLGPRSRPSPPPCPPMTSEAICRKLAYHPGYTPRHNAHPPPDSLGIHN